MDDAFELWAEEPMRGEPMCVCVCVCVIDEPSNHMKVIEGD